MRALPLAGRTGGTDRVIELGIGVGLNIGFESGLSGLVCQRFLASGTDWNELLQSDHLVEGSVQFTNGFGQFLLPVIPRVDFFFSFNVALTRASSSTSSNGFLI